MKIVNDTEYLNLRWPRDKAKQATLEDLNKSGESLAAKISQVRQKKKEDLANKQNSKSNPSDNHKVPL